MYRLAHVIVNAPINILLHLALHVLFIICETLQIMERSTNTLFVFCKNIFNKMVQLFPNSIERFWSALDISQMQKRCFHSTAPLLLSSDFHPHITNFYRRILIQIVACPFFPIPKVGDRKWEAHAFKKSRKLMIRTSSFRNRNIATIQ